MSASLLKDKTGEMSIVIMDELENWKRVCHTVKTFMKQTASFAIACVLFLISMMAVAPVIANNDVEISNNGEGSLTNVDVQTNTGNNTICVNGKCTTSGGSTGASHVCINGKCYDSDSGNLNVQSDDGHAKVTINNNSNTATPAVEPAETQDPSETVNEDVGGVPTPEISKIIEEHKNDIDKQKQQIDAHLARHQALLQGLLDSLNNFFKNFRLF